MVLLIAGCTLKEKASFELFNPAKYDVCLISSFNGDSLVMKDGALISSQFYVMKWKSCGENIVAGSLTVGDVPQPEMINKSRKIGYNMYKIRAKSK